ncbi:hypothetical protein [Roseomonas haemaphysalidis]|uniref:CTP synthetase n=1 Tax=Roseomonas haemaphysalidis TaxID=2768162 RepID=A0ABS3KIY5_9PROT|nr:hypothetical protein [Roseomonas haemaphysalidis]MBO1077411.1 hypothetical protein [Roseomonas haemaphysalidis]
MMLFLVTSAVLLGLLVGIPLWSGQGFDNMPFLMIAGLGVAVLVSAVWGRTRPD